MRHRRKYGSALAWAMARLVRTLASGRSQVVAAVVVDFGDHRLKWTLPSGWRRIDSSAIARTGRRARVALGTHHLAQRRPGEELEATNHDDTGYREAELIRVFSLPRCRTPAAWPA